MTPSRYAFIILVVAILMMVTYPLWSSDDSESPAQVQNLEAIAGPSADSEEAEDASAPVAEAVTETEAGPLELSAQEKDQLRILVEIFQTKNDNDPRLDQQLRNLSEPLKRALRQEYKKMKPELRNELGTIAFLIAREVKEGRGSASDVEFLKDILLEKPCMSLADCTQPPKSQSPEDEHLQGIYETTAHYPQLMDLRYLRLALSEGGLNQEMKKQLIEVLEAALKSPNPRVVQEAQRILQGVPR